MFKRQVLVYAVAASLVACLAGCKDKSKTPALSAATATQLPTVASSAAPPTGAKPSVSTTTAPGAADLPKLSTDPSSVPVTSGKTTPVAAVAAGTTSAPARVRQPAALVPALAGKSDFGHAVAVLATSGAPCLSVDRLAELSGAVATAWVAKHPDDASNNDLPVIADEDGPALVCLPLSGKPTVRLSVSPHGQGVQYRAGTVDQLRHLLADPTYGAGSPTWYARAFFYRWHYDIKGEVDRVTAWWTP